jgi:hypothetical protein
MKHFIKLEYFSNSKGGMCFDDFKNDDKITYINLSLISSLNDIKEFVLPFSGNNTKQKHAILTMNNGDIFHIREKAFNELIDVLNNNMLIINR